METVLIHKVLGRSFTLQGKKVKCNKKLYWQDRVSQTWKLVTCPECLQCRVDTTKAKERKLNKSYTGVINELEIIGSELVNNKQV